MEVLIEGKLPKKISSVAEQDGMPPKLTVWYLFPRRRSCIPVIL